MSAYKGPMVQVKTADLIGQALDYAVAVALGHPLCEECCDGTSGITIGTGRGDLECFSPSTCWNEGGPLRDKFKVAVYDADHDLVAATVREGWSEHWIDESRFDADATGPNALVAICRAIVAFKIGDTVSVPAEALE